MMFRAFISIAAAVSLSSPDDALAKFEEKMKKKWDHILDKEPVDLAKTEDVHSTAAPTDLAVSITEPDVGATTAAPIDLSAALADLKEHIHHDAALEDHSDLLASSTTAAPDEDFSELLANLHQNVHDVHSSVHDVLSDTVQHPGIEPVLKSMDLAHHDADEEEAQDEEDEKSDSEETHPRKKGAKEDAGLDDAAEAETSSDGAAEVAHGAADSSLSSEQEVAMHGMKQLMNAVQMIVMLKPMLEPLREKLTLAVEHMPEAEAKKAKNILKHIQALDVFSEVTAGLMAHVIKAKDGTEHEKEEAMATLIVGVKKIQEKVAEHLMEMKAETHAEAPGHAAMPMDKMTQLLVKLGKKVAAELKDPANRHNPKVLLDIKLFLAVKDSVEKTQALITAGGVALKQASTPEEKQAVKAAVKKGMAKVVVGLKSRMASLKKEAILLAVAAAKAHEHSDDGHAAEDEEETHAKGGHSKKTEEEEPKTGDDKEEESEEEPKTNEESKSDDSGAKKTENNKAKDEGEDDGAKEDSSEDDASGDADAKEDEASEDDAKVEKKHSKKKHGAKSDEGEAAKNHPEISPDDIAQIFGDAADKSTKSVPIDGESSHLRTQ